MVLLLKPQAQFPAPHNHSFIALLIQRPDFKIKAYHFHRHCRAPIRPWCKPAWEFSAVCALWEDTAFVCTVKATSLKANPITLAWMSVQPDGLLSLSVQQVQNQPLKCWTFVLNRTFVMPSSSLHGDSVHENLLLLSWLVCHRKILFSSFNSPKRETGLWWWGKKML